MRTEYPIFGKGLVALLGAVVCTWLASCDAHDWSPDHRHLRRTIGHDLAVELCAAIREYEHDGYDVKQLNSANLYAELKPYLDTNRFEVYLYHPEAIKAKTRSEMPRPTSMPIICIGHPDNQLHVRMNDDAITFWIEEYEDVTEKGRKSFVLLHTCR